MKRQLQENSLNCYRLTEFFPLLNKMESLLDENQNLKKQLILSMQNCAKLEKPMELSNLLKALLHSASSNAGKKPGGQRYDSTLKEMASLIFSLGGLTTYQILSKNLPLPSVAAVRRTLVSSELIVEGQFRFKELRNFLDSRGFPRKVLVGEDETRINGRVQFHSKSNQLVGFVLPLNAEGLPIIHSFPATSCKKMTEYFETADTSNYAYCIMAQPLSPNSPTFCLALFGSNNKFDASQVLKRWKWMVKAAKNEGVEIIGIATDGDTRLLKCMKYMTIAPTCPWDWFQSSLDPGVIFFQDVIHIGAKLKSRLLKPSSILPFGKEHVASRGHLAEFINNVSKDKHELTLSFLNPKDKMNYRAVEKLSDFKVTSLLLVSVPNSEATAMYLEMIREVLASYRNPSLSALERVEIMWKWVIFLRIWRQWILDHEDYSLSHNFITANSYMCIELNALSLVHAIRRFRDSEEAHLFLPWLFSSQSCEEFFRAARSLTSTYSTVINFSMLELQHRVRRIDFMTTSFTNLDKTFMFPRLNKVAAKEHAEGVTSDILPEDFEVRAAIQGAVEKAKNLAAQFGMRSAVFPHPHLKVVIDLHEDNESSDAEGDSEDDNIEACDTNDDIEDRIDDAADVVEDLCIVSSGTMGLKHFEDVQLSSSSPFVKVRDGKGNICIVKKTSLCWLLSSGDTRMSSDRLQRVQASNVHHSLRSSGLLIPAFDRPIREESVRIGSWCAFRSEDKTVVIGRILAFSYLSGSTWRNQEYSDLSVPILPPQKNARGIGCLCSWFKISSNQTLTLIDMDVHGFYDLKHYICTIPRPSINGCQMTISCSLKDILKAK